MSDVRSVRNWETIITLNFIFYFRQNGRVLKYFRWTGDVCCSIAVFLCEGSCVWNTVQGISCEWT